MERRRCCSPRTTRTPSGSSTRANASPYVKDAFHAFVVHGKADAVNPAEAGTKAAAHYRLEVGAGQSVTVRLCLTDASQATRPFAAFEKTLEARRREADEFYRSCTPESASEDAARVMRQAFGGLFWTKQYYFFDVNMWLREHGVNPFDSPSSVAVRNRHWFHMLNDDVISMPDKWEYPWYAAWDLAFHAVALSGVDPDFAKHQLNLMLKPRFLHSNGQLPAYEWNFSDVNPPVHAWATLFQYRMEQAKRGEGDVEFLKRAFGKLLINFTWWVNRKDRLGKSVFEGGFLGLDNIGIFDRSAELPTGGHLEQADGTAWMAMFCQNMFEIAIELAAHDASYDDLVYKFAEHFLWIGVAMNKVGDDGMWDEEDGFYYDVLRLPDGRAARLKVRSLVGLLPLCATTVIEPWQRERVPRVGQVARDALRPHSRAPWRYPSDWSGAHEFRRPDHCGSRRCRPVAADPLTHAGRTGIPEPLRHPLGIAVARAASIRRARGREGVRGLLSAGRVGQRDVRRELQLARPRVVPDERPPHSRAVPVLCLLRRLLPCGVSHRLRQADDALRGRHGDLRTPAAHLPAR